jgi:small subunit ribosomal protein S2
MATTVDIKKLLEAGAHFGHKTSRWHPKMAPFIHSKRDGNHIIDLTITIKQLNTALDFVKDVSSQGKQVLFVGTKRQAKAIVQESAEKVNMPYVVNRWLGGMLTNRNTIGGRVKHLKDLEEKMLNGTLDAKFNKLEVQRFQEEIDQMNELYGGIKNLDAKLGAVFVTDISSDDIAVKEARKLRVPVIALCDTNVNPSDIDYPIAANDDAIKTLQLMCDYFAAAVESGRAQHAKTVNKEDAKQESKEEATKE